MDKVKFNIFSRTFMFDIVTKKFVDEKVTIVKENLYAYSHLDAVHRYMEEQLTNDTSRLPIATVNNDGKYYICVQYYSVRIDDDD